MAKTSYYDPHKKPRVMLLGVYAPYNKTKDIEGYYEEFISLAHTNGIPDKYKLFLKIRDIDSAYFATRGKLDQIKEYCLQHGIEKVIISEMLSVQQERNLADFLGCEVIDRSRLILEIFEKAAYSAEGKMQVAIAMLQHQRSRVAGKGVHLEQQAGGIGLRGGPGETAKERELRHIDEQIRRNRRQLEKLETVRETQRKRRLSSGLPFICLIGYTNAGKSTILNALTKSDVLAEDKLFATLDTTTRELYIDHKKIGLISDTVGFIQNLPHNLIEAFKSTLSELKYADLLLHVVDSSDTNWEAQIAVVHDVLHELGVRKDMLYVFNKIDQVENITSLKEQCVRYQPYVLTSARKKEGLALLKEYILRWHEDFQEE